MDKTKLFNEHTLNEINLELKTKAAKLKVEKAKKEDINRYGVVQGNLRILVLDGRVADNEDFTKYASNLLANGTMYGVGDSEKFGKDDGDGWRYMGGRVSSSKLRCLSNDRWAENSADEDVARADVIVLSCMDEGGCDVSAYKQLLSAIGKAKNDGKLVISYGDNNDRFLSGQPQWSKLFLAVNVNIDEDCKLKEDYCNLLGFIAKKRPPDFRYKSRKYVDTNKRGIIVGLAAYEELFGQLLFRKSILGAIFSYNSNSESKNVQDVKDDRNAKNEKVEKKSDKEVSNSGNQVK